MLISDWWPVETEIDPSVRALFPVGPAVAWSVAFAAVATFNSVIVQPACKCF